MNIKNEINKIIDQIQDDARNKEKKELSLARAISSLYTLRDSRSIAKHAFDEESHIEFEVPHEEEHFVNTDSISMNTQLEECPKCGAKNFIRGGDCVRCDRGLQI